MGDTDTTPSSAPKILPTLQNKSIISVVLGDYHNVALTSSGEVMTWGAYSAGALGLGDPITLPLGTPGAFETEEARRIAEEEHWGEPPAVEMPSKVRFDHGLRRRKDRFCFAIAAAGWHTGALVMDLEVRAVVLQF
jgi:SCF-associated factor 1